MGDYGKSAARWVFFPFFAFNTEKSGGYHQISTCVLHKNEKKMVGTTKLVPVYFRIFLCGVDTTHRPWVQYCTVYPPCITLYIIFLGFWVFRLWKWHFFSNFWVFTDWRPYGCMHIFIFLGGELMLYNQNNQLIKTK